MTLQQLKYAIGVSKYPSINEAAKHLNISQPSLSFAVKELEKEIGISIFSRNNKGLFVTREGEEFLGYARQLVQQSDLIEEKYCSNKKAKQHFSVTTQHYSFAVNAFVDLVKKYNTDDYDLTLRETRTFEIINDVRTLKSEIGILYLSDFNEKVIQKYLAESDLVFEELYTAQPHIFVSKKNPLSQKEKVTVRELEDLVCLSFEQGEYNSLYFSEELLSTRNTKKSIKVSDRATLFNLLIGLNGYTVCSGIISKELNGKDIVSIPLVSDESMRIGIILKKNILKSALCEEYVAFLRKHTHN
ncbi:MAG: LysR family transcriptional regulator [Spirochaetaceae bacterium]|nr:LysR family transcriptional regulator [Spirochaetaceae bacterium]